ncbi:hypothetical protein ACDN41_11770 [Priestia aryabhattai]
MRDAVDLSPPKKSKPITDGIVKRVSDDNPFKDAYKRYLAKKNSK